MSKYSDKVKRRAMEAEALLAGPIPNAAPLSIKQPGGECAEEDVAAQMRNEEILGEVRYALGLCHSLLARCASLALNWSECNRRVERFRAKQVKDLCRAAISRVDVAMHDAAQSCFSKGVEEPTNLAASLQPPPKEAVA